MSDTDFSAIGARLTGQAQVDRSIPRFHIQAIHQTFASKQAGRPIYEDREFVEIIVPGQRRSIVCEPVNEDHKKRWPKEYEAFRNGQERPLTGTPLTDWPNSAITRSRIEELNHFHIRTVEDLAGVHDNALADLGMGAREQREAAKKFLEVSRTGTGPLERLIADNFAKDDEIKRLKATVAEQAAELAKREAHANA